MKSISAGLKSLLLGNEDVFRYELLTITLQQGGGVYYYNNSDQDVVYNGHTYLAGDLMVNPSFKRGTVTTSIGTDTKTCEISLLCSASTLIGGVLVPAFAQAGGFDNAIIEVDCLPVPVFTYPSTPDTSRGTYNIWTGICGDTTIDRNVVKLQVSSLMRILQGSFPRNYCLPTCNNTLFDSACTLNKNSFKATGTVSSWGGTTTTNFETSLSAAGGYYSLGWIVFTSGVNNGISRTVKTSFASAGQIQLTYPLPFVPNTGDAFTIYAGCDKTETTCNSKFSNLAHFRGFPFVPNPMTLLSGVSSNPAPIIPTGPRQQYAPGAPGATNGKIIQ